MASLTLTVGYEGFLLHFRTLPNISKIYLAIFGHWLQATTVSVIVLTWRSSNMTKPSYNGFHIYQVSMPRQAKAKNGAYVISMTVQCKCILIATLLTTHTKAISMKLSEDIICRG